VKKFDGPRIHQIHWEWSQNAFTEAIWTFGEKNKQKTKQKNKKQENKLYVDGAKLTSLKVILIF